METSNLHFLVHPGYWLANRKFGENISKSSLDEEKKLLGVYQKKIDSLWENDVLVIFTPIIRKDYEPLRNDFDESLAQGEFSKAAQTLKRNRWFTLVKRAEKKLGKNCITFPNPVFLPPFKDEEKRAPHMGDVEKELKERGFNITENTYCEVWGTSLSPRDSSCVLNTARQAFNWFGFKNFPKIDVDATNRFEVNEKELTCLADDLKKKIPEAEGSLKKKVIQK